MGTAAPRSTPLRFTDLSPGWRVAVEQAWDAFVHGSLPIGAIVTDADGQIVARGRNRLRERHAASPHLPDTPYLTGSRLAHAEVNALLQLGYHEAPKLRLLTTTEPCPLCMGAARMASIAHVRYASRDPWAGCAAMAESVPYLARRGPTAEGPVPGLEDVLVAWQVVRHADWYGETPDFMPVWREGLPRGYGAGMELFDAGTLQALADRRASAEDAWNLARATLEGSDPR